MNILALVLVAAAGSSVDGMQPAPGVPTLLQSGIPQIPAALRERTAQYLNARAAALVDVSETGEALLVSTRFASTSQLHLVEAPLGMRTQLTFADEPVSQARFQPGDEQVVWYLQDKGGGEFF
ncbi:MAG TPA: S9 family peptidase, partial [Myxococcales bacterium]